LHWPNSLLATVSIHDIGSHIFKHLTSFAVRLFPVANGVLSVQSGDKLLFRVRISRVKVRVRVGIGLVARYYWSSRPIAAVRPMH